MPLFAGHARAWDATLNDMSGMPSAVVAVDKAGKKLFYLEKQSPLALKEMFPSIHGQGKGDKLTEGDLRTPEGVYFITGRIPGQLDFEEYGSQAHGLNYPNPVDRLRGKTGYGIWLHSKGHPIANQVTRGCIAIDLADIDILSPRLVPGTAVVVAENIFSEAIPQSAGIIHSSAFAAAPATEAVAKLLTGKTEEWNRAWALRSEKMFGFYDGASYSQAQGESFGTFRARKESLFKRLPWIQIFYGDIHVLQGPGYWVTWFEQYYRAPNLTTEGIRRLYWQPDDGGELKIVGMEWLPQDTGMERAYLENLAPGVASFVEDWRKAWLSADLARYGSFYAKNAVQDSRSGLDAIMDHKKRTWSMKKPKAVEFLGIRVRLEDKGVRVDMTQVYRDSAGYQDKGVKELLLYPEEDSWRIVSETWSSS